MAEIRQSGTRTIAPKSGSVNGSVASDITQNSDSQVLINSTVTIVKGLLQSVNTSGTATAYIVNTNQNAGSYTNMFGEDSPVPPDQISYSTTEQRKMASAYFNGGVGI